MGSKLSKEKKLLRAADIKTIKNYYESSPVAAEKVRRAILRELEKKKNIVRMIDIVNYLFTSCEITDELCKLAHLAFDVICKTVETKDARQIQSNRELFERFCVTRGLSLTGINSEIRDKFVGVCEHLVSAKMDVHKISTCCGIKQMPMLVESLFHRLLQPATTSAIAPATTYLTYKHRSLLLTVEEFLRISRMYGTEALTGCIRPLFEYSRYIEGMARDEGDLKGKIDDVINRILSTAIDPDNTDQRTLMAITRFSSTKLVNESRAKWREDGRLSRQAACAFKFLNIIIEKRGDELPITIWYKGTLDLLFVQYIQTRRSVANTIGNHLRKRSAEKGYPDYENFYKKSENKAFVDTLLLNMMKWVKLTNFEAADMEILYELIKQMMWYYREPGIIQSAPFIFGLLKSDEKEKAKLGAIAVSRWLWEVVDIFKNAKPTPVEKLKSYLNGSPRLLPGCFLRSTGVPEIVCKVSNAHNLSARQHERAWRPLWGVLSEVLVCPEFSDDQRRHVYRNDLEEKEASGNSYIILAQEGIIRLDWETYEKHILQSRQKSAEEVAHTVEKEWNLNPVNIDRARRKSG